MKARWQRVYWLMLGSLWTSSTFTAITWSGMNQPVGTYTDQNIIIDGTQGDIAPTASVTVVAATQDVTITPQNNPVFVTHQPLYIKAQNGYTVTFDLSQSGMQCTGDDQGQFLLFIEQVDAVTPSSGNPAGSGVLIKLGDNQVFQLDAGAAGNGTWLIGAASQSCTPSLYIVRANTDSNDSASIVIGTDSLMTAVADSNNQTGTFTFIADGTNAVSSTGRLQLQLHDTAACLIATHALTTTYDNNPLITDIDLTTQTNGALTTLHTLNSQAESQDYWSSLLITNSCTELTKLYSNPFFEANTQVRRYGFVVSNNGALQVGSGSYIDYVGLSLNQTPSATMDPALLKGRALTSVIKPRNPSALFIDGDSHADNQANVIFGQESALYFRSGVGKDGSVSDDYLVVPALQNQGAEGYGQTVFDVEAPIILSYDQPAEETAPGAAVQILSWQVAPQGGTLFAEVADVRFPERTFAQDVEGNYYAYNTANVLINSQMTLQNVVLQHTDELKAIYARNFPHESAATYLGGERHYVQESSPRSLLMLDNAVFALHTSGACTGLDIVVPQATGNTANESYLTFYTNGYAYDQEIGRSLIMGTDIGAFAADGTTRISNTATLAVQQQGEVEAADTYSNTLYLSTDANTSAVTPGLSSDPNDLAGQSSAHTLFVAHDSMINVGVPTSTTFTNYSASTLALGDGAAVPGFISIQSQGGDTRQPQISQVTGSGYLFVGNHGSFLTDPLGQRMHLGIIVGRLPGSSVALPLRSVVFDDGFGIANVPFSLADTQVVVAEHEKLEAYTLDWDGVTKKYGTNGFLPYEPSWTPGPCAQPVVTRQNVSYLPTIQGSVEQLLIKKSQIGYRPHILIDGGEVDAVVLLDENELGVNQSAVIVLQNHGKVGLGSMNRNRNSLDAKCVLGLNGITIIANGDGQVQLNNDITVDGVCAFLPGPDFSPDGVSAQTLTITAAEPRELRIRAGASLDLSQFHNGKINFSGQVTLTFEPGSKLILGDSGRPTYLQFTHEASLVAIPVFGSLPAGDTVTSTDPVRVRFIGNGVLSFEGNSAFKINRNATVGIETGPLVEGLGCATNTDLLIHITDSARLLIGSTYEWGGALQVGNTIERDGTINFTLQLDGMSALTLIGGQGFLGFGAGIVRKPEDVVDTWLIGSLFNVGSINLIFTSGTFTHNRAFSTMQDEASLLAFGPCQTVIPSLNLSQTTVSGGGNLIVIDGEAVAPIVDTQAGVISDSLMAGIFASGPIIQTHEVPITPSGTSQELFTYLSIDPYEVQRTKQASLALTSRGTLATFLNYPVANVSTRGSGKDLWPVTAATIYRQPVATILSSGGTQVAASGSTTVGVTLNSKESGASGSRLTRGSDTTNVATFTVQTDAVSTEKTQVPYTLHFYNYIPVDVPLTVNDTTGVATPAQSAVAPAATGTTPGEAVMYAGSVGTANLTSMLVTLPQANTIRLLNTDLSVISVELDYLAQNNGLLYAANGPTVYYYFPAQQASYASAGQAMSYLLNFRQYTVIPHITPQDPAMMMWPNLYEALASKDNTECTDLYFIIVQYTRKHETIPLPIHPWSLDNTHPLDDNSFEHMIFVTMMNAPLVEQMPVPII
jgi:hypothetical protein